MLKFIADLACKAGDYAAQRRKTLTSAEIHTKSTDTDLVTEVDKAVEKLIIESLRERTPGYAVWGEESGYAPSDSEYCWVIDPIDGTANFVHDFPFYSVSIGLRRGNVGVLGAIYAPKLGELFLAEAGHGATLNGEAIRVSKVENLRSAIVCTGFSCVRAHWKFDNLNLLPEIVRSTCSFRRTGSAAIDMAYVGCGRLDAWWELGVQPYDIAAGEVIVCEAGGTVCDMFGTQRQPKCGTLATNGLLTEKMLKFFDIPGGLRFE